MKLEKQDKVWMVFCLLFCLLMCAAIYTASEIQRKSDAMKLEIVVRNAQILELQKQLKSVDHRTDLINLCKILMEGIDDGKCDNMYNPPKSLAYP